jgi:hypothetical protein
MAFLAVDLTNEPRAFSIGPIKAEFMTYTCVSGDTSGTVTASSLTSMDSLSVPGLNVSAISISGNVATITFADPAANRTGLIICVGR